MVPVLSEFGIVESDFSVLIFSALFSAFPLVEVVAVVVEYDAVDDLPAANDTTWLSSKKQLNLHFFFAKFLYILFCFAT
jgi:hypothetical protein